MQPRPAGSKSRPQARKRANADDSAFVGPSGLGGGKRGGGGGGGSGGGGGERMDGTQDATTTSTSRAKRRRAEPASKRAEKAGEGIDPSELNVDFHSLPTERIRRYLIQTEAMPILYPSPCSTETPPLPSSLLNPQAIAVRVPSPAMMVGRTGRREGGQLPQQQHQQQQQGEHQQRRRSSRLQEEDARSRRAPILADAEAVHDVLATLAERHFEKQTVNEMEALQQFMIAIKTRF